MTMTQVQPGAVQVPHQPVVELSAAAALVGGNTIWSGVDITVGHGEFVAVLGPNGSGKSTLLKVLLGLQPVAAGAVRVLGSPPGRHNRDIGYLPQRRAFDADVRIRGVDIVALGLDGDRWGTPLPLLSRLLRPAAYRARQEQIAAVIDLVGASEYAHRPIGQCSGGEQQRLLIAQALIRGPRLLVLDEPLDSLDVPSQAGISALIQRVCREQGVAVLLVAHDVNPILTYLDKVVYVAGGTAVAGRPANVITADTLTRLYGTPIDVLHDRNGRLVVVGQRDVPAEHH
jgi:zinc/manganese transport system ATP-binding protein